MELFSFGLLADTRSWCACAAREDRRERSRRLTQRCPHSPLSTLTPTDRSQITAGPGLPSASMLTHHSSRLVRVSSCVVCGTFVGSCAVVCRVCVCVCGTTCSSSVCTDAHVAHSTHAHAHVRMHMHRPAKHPLSLADSTRPPFNLPRPLWPRNSGTHGAPDPHLILYPCSHVSPRSALRTPLSASLSTPHHFS